MKMLGTFLNLHEVKVEPLYLIYTQVHGLIVYTYPFFKASLNDLMVYCCTLFYSPVLCVNIMYISYAMQKLGYIYYTVK